MRKTLYIVLCLHAMPATSSDILYSPILRPVIGVHTTIPFIQHKIKYKPHTNSEDVQKSYQCFLYEPRRVAIHTRTAHNHRTQPDRSFRQRAPGRTCEQIQQPCGRCARWGDDEGAVRPQTPACLAA